MSDNYTDISYLLNRIVEKPTLRGLFDKKVKELDLPITAALEIIGISYRTLYGTLDGTQTLVDPRNLFKIANFLQISKEQVIHLYIDAVEQQSPTETYPVEKIKFIKKHFDLAVLKKAGLIENITDFKHIEQRINSRLGLRSIFEYRKPDVDIAFSSGLFKPENNLTRSFWIKAATAIFEDLDNPNEYDRQCLIKIFPHLRWYTLNEEHGLTEVIKALYHIGITVVYQSTLQTLQLRGATFNVNGKPCIVLANYMNSYPTLWFALIHELYHVLFDWEEIREHQYHLTDDSNELLSVREREKAADDFAREYLFSKAKLSEIKKYINDEHYLNEVASDNQVHRSIIYTFYAFDANNRERSAWARARKFSPDVNIVTKDVNFPWNAKTPLESYILNIKSKLYNK